MFQLIRTTAYKKKFQKLDAFEQRRILRFEKELKTQPFSGKPLGVAFVREKKFEGKRLFFVVYAQYQAVLLVTITTKKYQQGAIDHIRERLPLYMERIRELLRID